MNDITALMPVGKFMFEACGQRWHHIKHGEAQYAEPRLPMVKLYQEGDVKTLVEALEARDKQIAKYHAVLNSLAFVARRYLPDYDEHPEIQAADELLESADGIQVIEGEGQ